MVIFNPRTNIRYLELRSELPSNVLIPVIYRKSLKVLIGPFYLVDITSATWLNSPTTLILDITILMTFQTFQLES